MLNDLTRLETTSKSALNHIHIHYLQANDTEARRGSRPAAGLQ
jgi:hypothetical protein